MSGEDLVVELISEQRRRLIASVLSSVEATSGWNRLPQSEREVAKARIKDQINVFYDFCRDVIKVTHRDVARNEHAVELIAQVHASQSRIERRLDK